MWHDKKGDADIPDFRWDSFEEPTLVEITQLVVPPKVGAILRNFDERGFIKTTKLRPTQLELLLLGVEAADEA